LAPDYEKWGLAAGKFTITAFGGSQGADRINSSLLELTGMKDRGTGIQILLITGTRFYEQVTAAVREMDHKGCIDIRVYPFVDEMEKVYRVTDLVIARAGANTIFETAAAGIPSILIPYPFAIDDHQTYNARYMQKQGKSILIEEKDLKTGLLENKIKYLLKGGRKVYNRMRDCRPDITNMDSSGIICRKLMEDVY
jgi:UDP-N-acetylglucosamine--N-acetylmuramyl-(pentapeptide) pyrophosphoryl-undecaprenol N-acetylglucosamine transferase